MKRRDFLAGSAAAGFALGAPALTRAAEGAGPRQLLELRRYTFASEEKLKAFDDFLAKAAIPALNRAGIQPVGVFRMDKAENADLKIDFGGPILYVLMPYKSAEHFLAMMPSLGQDPEFTQAGEAILQAPKGDPAYKRFESELSLAFEQAPKVEVPSKVDSRLFQLRIYESHNDERAVKKIQMFNQGGEIGIFRRVGMNPVFFGQALVGSALPHLTYMLGFESPDAQKQAWGAFGKDPDWRKISKDPEYADTVSNITNIILRPAASSQI